MGLAISQKRADSTPGNRTGSRRGVALRTIPVLVVSIAALLAGPVAAEEGDGLDVLLGDAKLTLDFRYRYEFVDQDGFDRNANASTLRTRLGVQSGTWQGFDFNLEVNDVRHVLSNNFNAGGGTTPDRFNFPVVADPKGTRFNQGYINYSGLDDWNFRIGRQRINLDNQRFVGAVGWRQTEQVFDMGQASWQRENAHASFTYVQWVRRIFGPDSPVGKHQQDGTFFLNGGLKTPIGDVVGYLYHIDNEDQPTFSTDTYGIRLSGVRPVNEDWRVRYEAEFARQTDISNNPADISASYIHVAAGAMVGIFDFGVGWELLGGDDDSPMNEAFRTPLATLHKWNGWADQFLVTPAAGLSDTHLTFKATPGDFLIQARFHDFEADEGSANYGTELDLQFGYKINSRFRADLFLAEFDGDDLFGDVTKFWLQLYFKL